MSLDPSSIPSRITSLQVCTPDSDAGVLRHESHYYFSYGISAEQVALAMPVRAEPYKHGVLHPIFEMNLPEGFIRRQLSDRLQRYTRISDMLFLAIQGEQGAGRLQYISGIQRTPTKPDKLDDILRWDSREGVFSALMDRHLFNTTLSGMQPKVAVISDKASLLGPDLIVKTGGDDYPQLALNEYVCMSIAAAIGLAVPVFWLSDNHQLFVVERFDNDDDTPLGMEDFAVLMGRSAQDRYLGSYENAAKAVNLFTRSHAELTKFFDYVVLSCLLGNGDAHLKNFSILYSHPSQPAVLSPIYDVVCTQVYELETKSLALKMNKSRAFPDRSGILQFAQTLGVKGAEQRLETMADIAIAQLQSIDELQQFPALKSTLEKTISHTLSLNQSQLGYRSQRKDKKKRKTDTLLKP